jgi:hypothetical protein
MTGTQLARLGITDDGCSVVWVFGVDVAAQPYTTYHTGESGEDRRDGGVLAETLGPTGGWLTRRGAMVRRDNSGQAATHGTTVVYHPAIYVCLRP